MTDLEKLRECSLKNLDVLSIEAGKLRKRATSAWKQQRIDALMRRIDQDRSALLRGA